MDKGTNGSQVADSLRTSVEGSMKEAEKRAYERAKGGQDYSSDPPVAAPQSTGTAGKGQDKA